MYICRIFRADRPGEQIDARLLAAGAITIGRDPAADWPLDDPESLLSRVHCTLAVDDGAIRITDSSTNGTVLEGVGRLPRGDAVPLEPRQTVRIGALALVIDRQAGGDPGETIVVSLPIAPLRDWGGAGLRSDQPHPDASLLEAFCDGARLDVSTFSDEDPAVLMRRLGGIYRETVIGLAALMTQRAEMKQAQELDRTTVGAGNNNPVKWTSPRQLAEDLLRGRDHAFLDGADAIEASFGDLATHCYALGAGANAVVARLLDELDPDAPARPAAHGSAFSLRSRSATQLATLAARHQALRAAGAAQAFREGYRRGSDAPGRPAVIRTS